MPDKTTSGYRSKRHSKPYGKANLDLDLDDHPRPAAGELFVQCGARRESMNDAE